MVESELRFDPSALSANVAGLLDVTLGMGILDGDQLSYGVRFSFGSLDGQFATKLKDLLADCAKENITMVPYTGIRDPWEQARLWRQSRTTQVVNDAIKWLKDNDAPFLSKVLNDVGPQPNGDHVTDALPGFSWHQWGEAADCYWSVNGKPEWDDLTGYKRYAKLAEDMGLIAGGHWTTLKDWPHVQKRTGSPSSFYSTSEIDKEMKARFDRQEFRSLIYFSN